MSCGTVCVRTWEEIVIGNRHWSNGLGYVWSSRFYQGMDLYKAGMGTAAFDGHDFELTALSSSYDVLRFSFLLDYSQAA